MENVSLRNKAAIAIIAAMTAAIVAFGLSALPTQAYADYAAGTPASQVTVKYKASKSKIKGTWKLIGSSNSYEKYIIKTHKRAGVKDKFTFKKNGSAIEKNYGKAKQKYKWVAAAKKKGYLVYGGQIIAKIKVKGKKLIISGPGLTRKYKRI